MAVHRARIELPGTLQKIRTVLERMGDGGVVLYILYGLFISEYRSIVDYSSVPCSFDFYFWYNYFCRFCLVVVVKYVL